LRDQPWIDLRRNLDEFYPVVDKLIQLKALNKAPSARTPRNLPFASLGSLFKGREGVLERLRTGLTRTSDGSAAAATATALQGLGGVGKTRAAIEYALRHSDDYSALLFVRAETRESLEAGLAALAGADILNLPEKEAHEDAVKIAAVLGWLAQHPVWLMILDNVDDRRAAVAVEKLMPKLSGGRVLITGRIANFSAAVEMLPLDVLDIGDATAFLLERTQGRRTGAPDDAALAQELAENLGRLALGLEQAGAYIATKRIGITAYLKLWQENRAKVLNWFDKNLMAYDHDAGLAATWAASVEQLTPAGRRLLERLAYFAPEPVPETLLDVAAPGGDADFDAHEALADLFAHSLTARIAAAAGEPTFAIHRLVQDFTQRGMEEGKHKRVLAEALEWVNAAFVGNPTDVRSWLTLDPLSPHVLTLARHADDAGITEPTSRLMNQLGSLFYAKSRYAEAEPLMRRALAITEARYGPDHPTVASSLNNLAEMLRATNRLAEAEPMVRRALAITEASHGPDHPTVATTINNLAQLFQATNRLAEAEPMYRRALAIDEASYGPDHPDVAIDLNNIAGLLQATNRLAEAEPLYRRALAIDEARYGPNHPDVAIDLNNLAQLLLATNRLPEAEPLMRRVVEILLSFTARTGHQHPNLLASFGNYTRLLVAMGRSKAKARAAIKALVREHGVKL
jgi:tetratricopeptide (TPR) repeat protein